MTESNIKSYLTAYARIDPTVDEKYYKDFISYKVFLIRWKYSLSNKDWLIKSYFLI